MNIALCIIPPVLLLLVLAFSLRAKHGSALRRGLVLMCLLPVLCFGFLSEGALAFDCPMAYEDDGEYKRYGAQVASSSSRANCETCVERLWDEGYRAYIYRPSGSSKYKIVIGCYNNAADAKTLAEELHDMPAVKGVALDHAYAVNVYLTYDFIYEYVDPYIWSNWYWGSPHTPDGFTIDGAPVSTPKPTSKPGTKSSSSSKGVDIFNSDDCDVKIVSVQVAASTSSANCKTCVERLQKAGYNAFIYHATGGKQYRIMIGIFSDVSEGEEFAEILHDSPAVKGVSLNKAYATNIRIPSSAYDEYCNPYL